MNQNDMVLLPVENVVMIADTSEKHTQEDFFSIDMTLCIK